MTKDDFLTMRIRRDIKEKLKKEAEKQERTLTSLIAFILKEYVNGKQ